MKRFKPDGIDYAMLTFQAYKREKELSIVDKMFSILKKKGLMGDTGEAFKAMNEHQRNIREAETPKRFHYALKELNEIATGRRIKRILLASHSMQIFLDENKQIDFYPYTGWFCGRKPLGHVKGRGLANLIKEIKKCSKT